MVEVDGSRVFRFLRRRKVMVHQNKCVSCKQFSNHFKHGNVMCFQKLIKMWRTWTALFGNQQTAQI